MLAFLKRASRSSHAPAAVASVIGASTVAALLPVPCIFCDVRPERGFQILFEVLHHP